MDENYCTTREAANVLGISLRTAQKWLEKGLLDGWKTHGGHRRITRSSILRVLQNSGNDKVDGYSLAVLIVEDNVELLKLYRVKMSLWPFAASIYSAPNGYEGLLMVGEVTPALLICDLGLPGVNGFQIVRTLATNERYHDMTIVVVSGLPLSEIDAHGGLPPGVELLGKPIDFTRLQAIAAALWHRHSTAHQRDRVAAAGLAP